MGSRVRIPPSPPAQRAMLSSVALFLFRCAGGNGEPEPLRGLELHAIGQPCCYILIRFVCQQSLKGESLRPTCNRDNTSKRCLFSFRCTGGDGEPEPLRGLELHAIGQSCCYILIRFACQQSLKGESLRPYSHSRKCFQALSFFILLRRRRRRARAPARARAARDWADGLIVFYILLLQPIAERRIPPSYP